jgi:putative DNA primase/helicase
LFKGYIPTKGKKPLEEYKDRTKFYTYEYIRKSNSDYGGILDDNMIQIDVDDANQSEILYKIIQSQNIQCSTLKTERGRHFYFINPGITRRKQGYYTPIGIKVDIGLGSQNAVIPLKVNGKTRRLTECNNPQELPKWLYPLTKTSIDFSSMSEGDGRNQTLFNYILTLQGAGMSVPDIKETIKIINKYILQQPLPEHEINTILRDEAFMKESFYIKGKLQYEDLAKYLIENQNIVKINNQLHIYKDGVYTNNLNEIEKSMLQYINNSTKNIRNEVINYLNLLAPEQVQAPSNLIALGNGIFDITTKQLQDFNPKIIIKNKIPINYNPEAYSEIVDITLNKICCNDKQLRLLIEEMIGYTLFRRNELRKCFILTGNGQNGKSTLLKVIKAMLGNDNLSSVSLKELGDRFKTYQLEGKLANIGDDISNKYIDDNETFKKLVTGETVNVERKGKDPFDFENYSKLIFSANDLPRINDLSDGLKSRLIFIPFNAKFTKDDPDFDPFIKDKLLTNESLEYLLKISITALERILKNNSFTASKASQQIWQQYEEINNPVIAFLEDNKIENEPTKDIYLRYSLYCNESGLKALSRIAFSREVCKHGFNTDKKIKGERIFQKNPDMDR